MESVEDPMPLFPGEEVRGRKRDGLTTFQSVRYVKISTIDDQVKQNPHSPAMPHWKKRIEPSALVRQDISHQCL